MPVDYANTWFYKIVSKDTTATDCFVGYSTAQPAATKESHITKCKTLESPVYKFIRNNGGIENFEIVKLSSKPCVDKSEALREQRKYFEECKATLNGRVPGRSKSEYAQESTTREQQKNYRQANKTRIAARGREDYDANKTNILEHRREYYKANRERILEASRVRYKRTVELKKCETI
jgi:hypothetical protein